MGAHIDEKKSPLSLENTGGWRTRATNLRRLSCPPTDNYTLIMTHYTAKSNYTPINLSDYWHHLNPYKNGRSESERECPSCGGKLIVKKEDKQVFDCIGGCEHSQIRKACFELGGQTHYNPEELARRQAKEDARIEAERERIAKSRTEAQRDKDWKQIVYNSFLSDGHRQQLIDRGFTTATIAASQARSSARGLIIPIRTAQGLLVGSQVVTSEGKRWYTSGDNRLKETNELPLTVVYPSNPQEGVIAWTESTLHKPWLCAQNFRVVTVGSSNVGTQFKDVQRTIAAIQTKYAWDKITHVLMADGGAVLNPGVMAAYSKLELQISQLGGTLLVRWYGQAEKGGTDIDEIAVDTPYNDIPFAEFLAIAAAQQSPAQAVTVSKVIDKTAAEEKEAAAKVARNLEDRKHYELLTTLTHSKYSDISIRSEQYLSPLTIPAAGMFTFVSSPCGTGKTEQVKGLIAQWRSMVGNGGKLIDITHRNSLRDGHQKRLGIDDYKVGNGQNEAALNSLSAISICVDSILKLNIEEIPTKSLVILDEMEAILAHLANAGTLGNRAADVCHHFAKVLARVLSTGGWVFGLEDNLTDIAINMVMSIVNREHGCSVIVNDYEKFHWDVQVGSKNFGDFLTKTLYRIANGERVVMPISSQQFGEAFERVALKYVHALKGKTLRIDAKTAPELEHVLRDPNQYLRDNDIQVLLLSPTVESGLSINAGFFDTRIAYFANLETRQHIQLLHRERSNIPTDVFIKARGADANSSPRNFKQLAKIRKQIALATSMLLGESIEPETDEAKREGMLWNEYAAMIAARKQLAANHAKDYLILDLASRNHNIIETDWASGLVDEMFAAKQRGGKVLTGSDVLDVYKEMREEITIEENEILFLADGLKLTVAEARSILSSSGQTFGKKQQAKKCIIHDQHPGLELSRELLLTCFTRNRGRYGRQIHRFWLLDKPELSKELDRRQFIAQKNGRHFRHDQTSKHAQLANLFAPILDDLKGLAAADEYSKSDERVTRIKAYAVTKSVEIFRLLSLNIKAESEDSEGKITHSAIDTVNKLLKSFGYIVKVARKEGAKGNQVRIYTVTNSDCPYRKAVRESLEVKHQEFLYQVDTVVTFFNTNNNLLKTVTTANAKVGDWIEIEGHRAKVCFKNSNYMSGHYENGTPFGFAAA